MCADAPDDHAPALDGIRLIDATEDIGGPYAAMLLAEQGADVIKIERPGGDPSRSTPAFHVLNRSKRSVVLDLQADAGRADLRALLRDADVFLYDWPPRRDADLGFDSTSLRTANPRLIIGYLPAYGSDGPHADLPADEALVQAVSGAADAQFRYDAQPAYINIPIAGYAQGIIAAGAVAASLYARTQTGQGDAFELSQVAAIFAMETVAYIRAAGVQRMAGRTGPRGGIPTYRLVRASDDWLFAGALTPGFWASLAVAAGLEDCLVDPRFAAAPMGIADMDARRELAARLDEAFTHRTRDEWLEILEDAGVPRAPVLSREEFARDPQVAHNEMVIDVDDPEVGPTKQMGIPLRLGDTPGRVRGPAPRLGEHQALIDDLDRAEDRRADGARTPEPGARRSYPLEGVVIVDLSGFIAGANGSMMLADMGATVIKVESLDGDGWRNSGLAFLGSNRGKRSVCIDLKREEGRALLLDLVERADVVMENYRAGVMDRLGIGYEALRARNPRIIHCSVTGYGPTGPYAHLPGFDPLFQARSGLMRAQGEPGGEPVYLQIAVCDYATALTAAYGVMAALVARERTGRGNRVETSLLNSAFTVQAGEFVFYDGRPPDPPGGRDLPGRHALCRVYAASDGYLTIACTTAEHASALAKTIGVTLPSGDPLTHAVEGELASAIMRQLAVHERAHWLREFRACGVPAAPCTPVEAIFDDEHLNANGLWWDFEHPRFGAVRQTGAVVRWQDMSMRIDRRAPLLGEHSAECLPELGITDVRVAELMRAGVVR
jgi:crotonobetainyl-CoA:carnitine CoA-transferase CaiB-like acyl-CoA transferase